MVDVDLSRRTERRRGMRHFLKEAALLGWRYRSTRAVDANYMETEAEPSHPSQLQESSETHEEETKDQSDSDSQVFSRNEYAKRDFWDARFKE
jgi:hypothetical protein